MPLNLKFFDFMWHLVLSLMMNGVMHPMLYLVLLIHPLQPMFLGLIIVKKDSWCVPRLHFSQCFTSFALHANCNQSLLIYIRYLFICVLQLQLYFNFKKSSTLTVGGAITTNVICMIMVMWLTIVPFYRTVIDWYAVARILFSLASFRTLVGYIHGSVVQPLELWLMLLLPPVFILLRQQ